MTPALYLDDTGEKVLAYVSLCNDAIRLETEERKDAGIAYSSAPALKIARIAVDTSIIGQGVGKLMIEFSAYQEQLIRECAGVFFLTLDCYGHRVSFYEKIGFVKNLIQPPKRDYNTPISMRIGIDKYLEQISE